jgi:hypothetical protein
VEEVGSDKDAMLTSLGRHCIGPAAGNGSDVNPSSASNRRPHQQRRIRESVSSGPILDRVVRTENHRCDLTRACAASFVRKEIFSVQAEFRRVPRCDAEVWYGVNQIEMTKIQLSASVFVFDTRQLVENRHLRCIHATGRCLYKLAR